jgi:hypothetical protein
MMNLIERLQSARSSITEEDKAKWQICNCSYDPHKGNSCERYNRCPVKLALRNHISFPSFEMLSEQDDPSTIYYDFDSPIVEPSRHWVFLLEIKEDITFMRPGVIG